MSTIDPSMRPMLEMFIYETTTLLEQLDETMLETEKSGVISADHINEIFRIMHTIKGSSAMMGLTEISNLAHAVEDMFFIIREDSSKLELVRDAVFDLVFQASDFFKAEVEMVGSSDYQSRNPVDLIAQLEHQADIMQGRADPGAPGTAAAAPAAQPAAKALQEAPDTLEGELHSVRVFFDDGCQMENIRAFMLVTQLRDYTEFIETVPENPENDSSSASDIIKNGFIIHFKPASSVDDVYKVIENAINVKSYEPLELAQAAPAAAAAQTAATRSAAEDSAPAAARGQQAEAAPGPLEASGARVNATAKQSLISVNQSKLDQLLDLVGELVTTESMVISSPDLKGLSLDNFSKSTRELRKLTDELQDVVMSIRMVPLSGVFQKMNRIVRDMGKKLGKEVELVTVGGETEVDKTINDSIADPFMHMVRNSCDHAIEFPDERRALGKPETGTITMAAQNVGGEIVITIADDGCGLDPDKILRKARENGILTKAESEYTEKEVLSLIMLPGFSTNEQVTEYSGRGVGMDVVRQNIEKVGGTIGVESQRGVGTTFTIKIPLTLAIVDGMEISVGDTVFTLPITSIKQSFKVFDEKMILHNTDGSEMILLRGECYPIIRLHQHFALETGITELTEGIMIQVENDKQTICLFADELLGEQQVVVKPFPPFFNHFNIKGNGLSGCTILGDGSISLILDANSLMSIFER